MKPSILLASLLLFALPAVAQSRGAVAANSAPQSSGGGAAGGGFGSSFSSSFGSTAFSGSSASSTVHFQIISAHGSQNSLYPTRFVPYAEALKLGRAAVAARPKTIAEIAAEYRSKKAESSAPKH